MSDEQAAAQPPRPRKRKTAPDAEADRESRTLRVQALVAQIAPILKLNTEQSQEWIEVLSTEYPDREDAAEKLQLVQRSVEKRVVTDPKKKGRASVLYICPHRSSFHAQVQREKVRIQTIHDAAVRSATDEEKNMLEETHKAQLRSLDDKLRATSLCKFHLLLKYAGDELSFWYWVIDEDTQILHTEGVCAAGLKEAPALPAADSTRGPPRLSRLEGAKSRRLGRIEALVAEVTPVIRLSAAQAEALREMLTAEYPSRETPGKRLVDFQKAHLRKLIQTDVSTRGGHCVRYICAQRLAAKKPVLREKESLRILHAAAMDQATDAQKPSLEQRYQAELQALQARIEGVPLCRFQVMLKRQTSTSSVHWYFAIDDETEFLHTPGVCTVVADDNDKATQCNLCTCPPLPPFLSASSATPASPSPAPGRDPSGATGSSPAPPPCWWPAGVGMHPWGRWPPLPPPHLHSPILSPAPPAIAAAAASPAALRAGPGSTGGAAEPERGKEDAEGEAGAARSGGRGARGRRLTRSSEEVRVPGAATHSPGAVDRAPRSGADLK